METLKSSPIFSVAKGLGQVITLLLSGVIAACLTVPLMAKLFGVQLLVASTGAAPTIGTMYLYMICSVLTLLGLSVAIIVGVALLVLFVWLCVLGYEYRKSKKIKKAKK